MKSDQSRYSRREVLAGASAAGAVGVMSPVLAKSPAPDFGRLSKLRPLRPAPLAAGQQPAESALPPFAARVLNKAGYGPRPGDLEAFNALGEDDASRLAAWLDEQLSPVDGDDAELNGRLDPLKAAGLEYDRVDASAAELWLDARSDDYFTRKRPVWQMERLTLLRAAYSKWQLREVLWDFWFNHFNVYEGNFPAYGMMPEYDRQLRAHLFGRFEDMLKANARTASMLYYLDNYANTWPSPNENYAREVLELHTLGAVENYYGAVEPATVGVNGKGERAGYTEIDVFQFARALTGWGVADGRSGAEDTGAFLFRAHQHYDFSDGDIEVMDLVIEAPGGGESDVTDVLTYLARHYGTARHVAWKLCIRLVGDDPDPALVDSAAEVFYANRDEPDQLKRVYRHILESAQFASEWGSKVKRPTEAVVRAIRGAGMDFTVRLDHDASNRLMSRLEATSHFPFLNSAPTGFPDQRAQWQGSGALVMTWRTITRMLRESTEVNLAEQTNIALPNPEDRTPANLVSLWMDRALGYELAAGQVQAMHDFITGVSGLGGAELPLDPEVNTADTGATSTYQRILMAVVGLVLMSPDAMRR